MTPCQLRDILDSVRVQPDLIPRDGKTFCNIALDRILKLCDYPRFINPLSGQPHLANDMIDAMRASPSRWTQVSGAVACARASRGVLVVAAQQASGHGHLAPVMPLPTAFSASWGKEVPMLSNVGRRNDILRASQCFRAEPEYYSVKITGVSDGEQDTCGRGEMVGGV